MAEETLLTAARRIVRFLQIDEARGGLLTVDTIKARETLDKMVRRETERQKQCDTNSDTGSSTSALSSSSP